MKGKKSLGLKTNSFIRAKKALGQNFLKSKKALNQIVVTGNISPNDIIVEAGPGKGYLTELLLQKSKKVIAVEKDDQLINFLKEKFQREIKEKKLEIIHGDILSFNPSDYALTAQNYKVIANIPYYITGQFLRLFLSSPVHPSLMVLMLQKEVVERIITRDKKESILSLSVKVYGTPRYIDTVKARYFRPKPKIDSAIILIDEITKKKFEHISEDVFFKTLKLGFAHKRKKLIKNLAVVHNMDVLKEALINCDINPDSRAEDISLDKWLCLCQKMPTVQKS